MRRLAFVLVATTLSSTLMLATPAYAAVQWECDFGPQTATDPSEFAYFHFHWVAGPNNDTLTIDGGGRCYANVYPCVGFTCGLYTPASIHGSATEGNIHMHFGTCDADGNAGGFPRLLSVSGPGIPVSIRIRGRGSVNEALTFFGPNLVNGSFPGPEPIGGYVTSTGKSFRMLTRIGGQCPSEGGSFRATFEGIKVTTPL